MPSELQAAEAAAMGLLSGRVAERAFWPLCGQYALALHEAAHCAADHFSGTPASRVSIIAPDSATAGYVLSGGSTNYADAIRVQAREFVTSDERLALLMLHLGDPTAGWKTIRARMRTAERAATEFVRRHHFAIGQFADHLLKVKTMDGQQIRETIEAALADPRAALPPEPLPGIAKLEAQCITALAGAAAARRSLRSSTPGWTRWRAPEELRAHHESGHGVLEWVLQGRIPWKLSIAIDETVRIGKTGFSGGFCAAGDGPKPPGPIERPARAETDLRKAARLCLVLGAVTPPPPHGQPGGIRAAIRAGHRLRKQARDLVEQHWCLIARLAAELAEHQELDHTEIACILKARSA